MKSGKKIIEGFESNKISYIPTNDNPNYNHEHVVLDTMVFRSAIGTFKTGKCIEYAEKNPGKSILIMVPMRSQTEKWVSRGKHLGFENYLDYKVGKLILFGNRPFEENIQLKKTVKKTVKDLTRVVISSHSMWRLSGRERYDIFFIDEVEQFCSYFLDDLSMRQDETWRYSFQSITQHIKNAVKVIVLSADVSYRTMWMLESLRPDINVNVKSQERIPPVVDIDIPLQSKKNSRMKIFINTHKLKQRNVTIGEYENSREIIAYIIEKIKKGKRRIGFVCGSNSLAEECSKYADSYSVKHVLHNNKIKDLDVVRKINDVWSKVDLVIFSHKIADVSFKRNVGDCAFDELVVYMSQQSTIIRDQFQMTMTFRHLTSNNITLFYGKEFDEVVGEPTYEYARSIVDSKKYFEELDEGKFKEKYLLDIDFAWAEPIAALNVLEIICDKKKFEDVIKVYAKHYNWNFSDDEFIPAILQLE